MQNKQVNKKLTIFTPTYNREKYLHRLYHSLIKQTCKNFIWLIIDDGSNDNTYSRVSSWIDRNEIEIKYLYQKNKGKHFAYNRAIDEVETELFIDVDSDDYFLEHTVERLIHLWESLPEKREFAGIMALCQFSTGKIIGQKYPANRFVSTPFELRYKHSVRGDKAILYASRVLKGHSLPEIPNEVVMESILYNRIARKYKSMCYNEPLIVKEYLPDGLSKGTFSSMYKNLNARVLQLNEMNFFNLSYSQYMHINSRYVKYSLLNNSREIYKNAINRKAIFVIAFLVGYMKYWRVNIKYGRA